MKGSLHEKKMNKFKSMVNLPSQKIPIKEKTFNVKGKTIHKNLDKMDRSMLYKPLTPVQKIKVNQWLNDWGEKTSLKGLFESSQKQAKTSTNGRAVISPDANYTIRQMQRVPFY